MGPTITDMELAARCSEVIAQVEKTGQPIIVLKNGEAVAKVVPITAAHERIFGALRGSVQILCDLSQPTFSDEEVEAWEAEMLADWDEAQRPR